MTGRIARIKPESGFGFITAGGVDYFFHRSDLTNPNDFETLDEGNKVTFEETHSPKGPRASKVMIIP